MPRRGCPSLWWWCRGAGGVCVCGVLAVETALMVMTVARAEGNVWLAFFAYANWLVSLSLFLGAMELVDFARRSARYIPGQHRGGIMLAERMSAALRDVDKMLKDPAVGKEDALLKARQDLCGIMQCLISEPHKTSFALPHTVDFFMDDFVVKKVEEEIADQLGGA
eukprot:764634-Hanusia_phi.AAC.8